MVGRLHPECQRSSSLLISLIEPRLPDHSQHNASTLLGWVVGTVGRVKNEIFEEFAFEWKHILSVS